MVEGSLESLLGKTVKCVSYDSENGIVLTFTDGTVLHAWGGIPRSWDVNVTVSKP